MQHIHESITAECLEVASNTSMMLPVLLFAMKKGQELVAALHAWTRLTQAAHQAELAISKACWHRVALPFAMLKQTMPQTAQGAATSTQVRLKPKAQLCLSYTAPTSKLHTFKRSSSLCQGSSMVFDSIQVFLQPCRR